MAQTKEPNRLQAGNRRNAGPSRPLDVNRWADYPELRGCISDIIDMMLKGESRQRRRDKAEAKRLREAVRCLVLDLYVAWKTDPRLEVGISLSSNHYNSRSRYRAIFLSYQAVRDAFYGLLALGYLQIDRHGFSDPRSGIGRVTRARATERLISTLTDRVGLSVPAVGERLRDGTEVIVLRDPAKKEVSYEDTAETKQMREEVHAINVLLDRNWIDLYLTDDEFTRLEARMRTDAAAGTRRYGYIDLTRRRLVRIFNNESFLQGGRLYGGWWQNIPEFFRRYIYVNGKPTAELDYSGLHVSLLYEQENAELIGDAYDIGIPQIPRDFIKRTFNKLLNAQGRIRHTDFDEAHYGVTRTELLARIRKRHSAISKYLGTGEGIFLQRRDADIAVRVVLQFAQMGYVCLPIHDSFIVHYELRDELGDIMNEEMVRSIGRKIKVKPKVTFLEEYEPGASQNDDPEGAIALL